MDDNAGLLGGNLSFAVAGIPGASGTLFLVDTRNYTDSTPLFSVDTRSPDLIANTGITDSGGNSFTITMEMLNRCRTRFLPTCGGGSSDRHV